MILCWFGWHLLVMKLKPSFHDSHIEATPQTQISNGTIQGGALSLYLFSLTNSSVGLKKTTSSTTLTCPQQLAISQHMLTTMLSLQTTLPTYNHKSPITNQQNLGLGISRPKPC